MRLPSITRTDRSIGGLALPTMRRAPSNAVGRPVLAACCALSDEYSASRKAMPTADATETAILHRIRPPIEVAVRIVSGKGGGGGTGWMDGLEGLEGRERRDRLEGRIN